MVKKPTYIALFIISGILIFITGGIKNPRVTSWDNFGYYAVLPQTFIQHDPGNSNFSHLERVAKKYNLSSTLYQFHKLDNENYICQYPLGMAFFYTPAFVTGHIIAKTFGYEADGFSKPYQYCIIWFEVFYVLLSFFLLRRVLLNFFTENISAFLLLICFFGTNYFISVTEARGMPHQYLFLLYIMLIIYTIKWHKLPQKKYACYLGLILGLMAITRPTDALAFLMPLLWGVKNWKGVKDKLKLFLKSNRSHTILMLVTGFTICMIQFIFWKIFTGKFIYYSYKNQREIFELLKPNTFNFLFSFRKGWFIYTPVMLVAISGIVFSFRKKVDFGLAFLVFTTFTIYILSSWSCWWYAASFSQRSMVQSYPVFIIGLGFLLTHLFGKLRIVAYLLSFLISCFIFLNLYQTWQINEGILVTDRMTKEFYVKTFGVNYIQWGVDTLLMIDHDKSLFNELPRKWNYEAGKKYQPVVKSDSANVFFVIPTKFPVVKIQFPVMDMKNEMHAWYHVSFEYKLNSLSDTNNCVLIETMVDNHERGYNWKYSLIYNRKINSFNGWRKFENYYLTPVRVFEGDKFLTGFDYKGKSKLMIRNFNVREFLPKMH